VTKPEASQTTQRDNLPFAVGVILFTVFALSLGDTLVKLLSANFVLWPGFVLRFIIAIPVLIVFMLVFARRSLQMPTAAGWTLLRSLLLVSMWICYYFALSRVALSVAAATYYTLPIFITLLSALLIGDKVSRLGWLAVLIGFLGVLLILKPETGAFNWYALLPLVSAMLYALAMILTRTHCRNEHPLVLSLALNICFVMVGLVVAVALSTMPIESRQGFLLATWSQMNLAQWGSMALLAIALLIGSIGAAIAYQNASPSVIGTFDFAYVGFAVLWGIVFLAEVPDGLSVLGIALIVFAGLLSLQKNKTKR